MFQRGRPEAISDIIVLKILIDLFDLIMIAFDQCILVCFAYELWRRKMTLLESKRSETVPSKWVSPDFRFSRCVILP